MKLEDQVVSLELAKRLKELGVKQDSALLWVDAGHKSFWLGARTFKDEAVFPSAGAELALNNRVWYSAFTVAELGEMLPGNDGENHFVTQKGLMGRLWFCSQLNMANEKCVYKTVADTEADARAKMLAYLIENKLITI